MKSKDEMERSLAEEMSIEYASKQSRNEATKELMDGRLTNQMEKTDDNATDTNKDRGISKCTNRESAIKTAENWCRKL